VDQHGEFKNAAVLGSEPEHFRQALNISTQHRWRPHRGPSRLCTLMLKAKLGNDGLSIEPFRIESNKLSEAKRDGNVIVEEVPEADKLAVVV
jgi:hypothetical protein